MSGLITSPGNPLLKRIRKLRHRKHRESEGVVFVEGIAPVLQALQSGAALEMLVVAPELLTSPAAREAVATAGVRVVEVTGDAFASIADREHPAGLGAIVGTPVRALADVELGGSPLVVALDEVGNPGNLGTVVRTADAAGADAVAVAGASADPGDPAAVKASMGTVFSTPVATATLDEVLAWSRAAGLAVVATSARASVPHWEATFPERCLLLFGSEARGLPADVVDAADLAVRIPQVGAASSLNLAAAAAILIYEARRGRI
ncbi:MAG TPA: RNA methyltransferase [Actinomycetota bacterium]|nr:RNA methyltransferase [Actinomycetota bacterium]